MRQCSRSRLRVLAAGSGCQTVEGLVQLAVVLAFLVNALEGLEQLARVPVLQILARSCQSNIHLVRVVHTVGIVLDELVHAFHLLVGLGASDLALFRQTCNVRMPRVVERVAIGIQQILHVVLGRRGLVVREGFKCGLVLLELGSRLSNVPVADANVLCGNELCSRDREDGEQIVAGDLVDELRYWLLVERSHALFMSHQQRVSNLLIDSGRNLLTLLATLAVLVSFAIQTSRKFLARCLSFGRSGGCW